MPYLPKKPCAFPQCKNLTRERFCYEHKKKADREYDLQRLSAYKRGYNGTWNKARKMYLNEHPLCSLCFKEGRIVPATDVHHIKPHKGNMELFWDENNWESLCHSHHSQISAWGNETKKQDRVAPEKR